MAVASVTLDTTLIGETAAGLMESLPSETGGEIVAVGIVVVVDDEDGTYTRIKCSSERYFEQLGIFHAAVEVARGGTEAEDGE